MLEGWNTLFEGINKAKMIVSSVAFIITFLVGGYKLFNTYIVTPAKASEIVEKAISSINDKVDTIEKLSVNNRQMLIEMRLIRIENKLANEKKLTPTEQRVYDKLKKEYSDY